MVFELFWRHTDGCGSGTWHRNHLRFVCGRSYNVQVKYLLTVRDIFKVFFSVRNIFVLILYISTRT